MELGNVIEYRGRRSTLTDTFVDAQGRRWFLLDDYPLPILEDDLERDVDPD